MSKVIKRSISLSPVVAIWADHLAEAKGYGTNFSAFIADLIRRDWEQNKTLKTAMIEQNRAPNSRKAGHAEDQIVKLVMEEAQKSSSLRKPK